MLLIILYLLHNCLFKTYYELILVGFINDSFFTEYTGSYTSEVHLKPQPIMIPIQNEKFKLLQTNIKELFNVESIGSFQNNSRLNVSFDSELLRVKKIFPNGIIVSYAIYNIFNIIMMDHVICFQQIVYKFFR